MLTDLARLLFALVLPLTVGALLFIAVWPQRLRRPGYLACVIGMGFLLGWVAVVAGYLILGYWGGGLRFGPNVMTQLFLAAVFGGLALWRLRQINGFVRFDGVRVAGGDPRDSWVDLSVGWRWLLGLIAVWLAIRWMGIVVEVYHRPLFPWDAWSAFGNNAKIWFFHPQLDVFAMDWDWFIAEEPVWASRGTRHPPGVGLIQLWAAQAIGRWDDALINLAWPFVLAATVLAIHGVLRLAGTSLQLSVLAASAVMTLPVLTTHAVLAGYADIWMGALILVAASMVYLARMLDRPGLLWLTLVAVAGMLMIKETSLLWVPLIALGMLVGWVRFRWVAVAFVLGVLGFLIALWYHGEPVRVSELGHLGFDHDGFVWPSHVGPHMWREITMWPALLSHLLVVDNWHFFWYLAPVITILGIRWLGQDPSLRALWFMFAGGVTLLLMFFAFTQLGLYVQDGASVNRLLLHLVPLGGLLVGVLVGRWFQAECVESPGSRDS